MNLEESSAVSDIFFCKQKAHRQSFCYFCMIYDDIQVLKHKVTRVLKDKIIHIHLNIKGLNYIHKAINMI